jgi:hypothetical protein
MVWGCIWLDERGRPRRSLLVIMERDPDALRGGYSSQSYIQALTTGLLPHWRRSQQCMQDNARVHTSHRTRAWLAEHSIIPITWPAYSPDLNPIEHLWYHLKKSMYKFYPQYNNYMRATEEWDGFCRALKDCWRRIPGALIRSLIMSMPRRLYACRRARGWQTKYRPCAHHWLKKSINLLIFWLSYDALKLWWMMLKFALRATGVQNF